MAEELAGELNNRFYHSGAPLLAGPAHHHRARVGAGFRSRSPAIPDAWRCASRVPTIANQLIDMLNQPLISTSANISGSPTCRSGIEVFGMMDGRVDLVLDGGACAGPGATTVDITEPYWKIIKTGAIEEKEIAECLRQPDVKYLLIVLGGGAGSLSRYRGGHRHHDALRQRAFPWGPWRSM